MFAWFNNCLIRTGPVIDRYDSPLFQPHHRYPFRTLSLRDPRSFQLYAPFFLPGSRWLTARSSSNRYKPRIWKWLFVTSQASFREQRWSVVRDYPGNGSDCRLIVAIRVSIPPIVTVLSLGLSRKFGCKMWSGCCLFEIIWGTREIARRLRK